MGGTEDAVDLRLVCNNQQSSERAARVQLKNELERELASKLNRKELKKIMPALSSPEKLSPRIAPAPLGASKSPPAATRVRCTKAASTSSRSCFWWLSR